MPPPLVSVLLPVRDAQQTLGAALRSVARQSEARFECVVVDDGSRDASLALELIQQMEGDVLPRLIEGEALDMQLAYLPFDEMQEDEVMTLAEAARQLGTSINAVKNHMKNGTLTWIENPKAEYHGKLLVVRREVMELAKKRQKGKHAEGDEHV